MARPAGNADEKLIKAAFELFPHTGFTHLKVREVAKKAGVNLGMFHYHFKNKEAFVERMMQDIYEQFFEKFQLETSISDDPETRLRNAIKSMSRFIRENRKYAFAFINDILVGNPTVQLFLTKNFNRHLKIFMKIIKECQKKRVIKKISLPVLLPFIMGSQIAPNFVAYLFETTKVPLPMELSKAVIVPKLLSEKAVEERLNLAINALRADNDNQRRKRK